jgi:predicted permease
MSKILNTTALICGLALATVGANASVINFEDQPAGPSNFGLAGPAQTLVYDFGTVTATFTGGVILTNESNQTTDNSNVYATSSFGDPTLTNPLVINFSQPIHNFQLDILNALAGSYTLEDNVGDSLNFNLATTGGSLATEGFAAGGTQIKLLFNDTTGTGEFDFAIDNVTFNQPLSSVPEPGTIPVLGAGALAVLGFSLWKRSAAKLSPRDAS